MVMVKFGTSQIRNGRPSHCHGGQHRCHCHRSLAKGKKLSHLTGWNLLCWDLLAVIGPGVGDIAMPSSTNRELEIYVFKVHASADKLLGAGS